MKDLIRAVKQLGLYYAHYHLFHNEQEEIQEVTHRCVLSAGHGIVSPLAFPWMGSRETHPWISLAGFFLISCFPLLRVTPAMSVMVNQTGRTNRGLYIWICHRNWLM